MWKLGGKRLKRKRWVGEWKVEVVLIETADEGDKGQCYQILMPYRILQSLIRGAKREKMVKKRKDKIQTGGSWRERERSDNLCVIYLCVMCIWEEYQSVKSRLDCLKVLDQGCPDWTQKYSPRLWPLWCPAWALPPFSRLQIWLSPFPIQKGRCF